jgi:hypothetical protein
VTYKLQGEVTCLTEAGEVTSYFTFQGRSLRAVLTKAADCVEVDFGAAAPEAVTLIISKVSLDPS